MRTKTINTIFLILGLLIIFGSSAQLVFKVFPIKPLNGSFTDSPKPTISARAWFDESLQTQSESWLNENFGFRNFFLRLDHQISLWLYKKAHSEGVIVGKENYLFEKFYIDALYGRDFSGIANWEEKIGKLSALNDSLQKLDKSFLICIGPSKAAHHREYIPEYLKTEGGKPYNYLYLKKRLSEENIPFIDMYSWFEEIKQDAEYPLFPKTGIHWSEYGQYLVGDSMYNYFNSLGYKMPVYILDSLDTSSKPNKQDTDIARAMNLLFPISQDQLAYPKFHVERDNLIKPRGIVVGDSFYWQFLADGMHKDFFDKGEFWYYNRDIIVPGGDKISQTKEYLEQRIKETDMIVFVGSEGGLSRFAWGFIDDLYSLYFGTQQTVSPVVMKKVNQKIQAITKDPAWLARVEKKAIDKSIPLDSMLFLDGMFMYQNEQLKLLKEN